MLNFFIFLVTSAFIAFIFLFLSLPVLAFIYSSLLHECALLTNYFLFALMRLVWASIYLIEVSIYILTIIVYPFIQDE